MHLLFERKPIHLQLKKELTRAIKRGHAWLYSDAIELIRGESGVPAVVHDRKGQAIACGIYDPQHPLPLRICRTQAPWLLDDAWLSTQLARAAALRSSLFDRAHDRFSIGGW